MPNIYNYLNYREFLQDYYTEQKRNFSGFSFQYFANKAGFKSKSFLKLVIDGKKNLAEESLQKTNRVLKLSPKAFSYFSDLVAFNQEKSLKLRNYFFTKVAGYNRRNKAKLILADQYEFYSKWYHNTIRELVTLFDFKEEYEQLGKMLKPAISARQAKQSVRLLLKLGLIKKNGSRYEQTDRIISTGDEVQSLAIHNFHLQNLALAAESIDTCSASKRDISCLILGLSEDGARTVKTKIQLFRKELLNVANNDKDPERVYHVGFQLFPTSDEKG